MRMLPAQCSSRGSSLQGGAEGYRWVADGGGREGRRGVGRRLAGGGPSCGLPLQRGLELLSTHSVCHPFHATPTWVVGRGAPPV